MDPQGARDRDRDVLPDLDDTLGRLDSSIGDEAVSGHIVEPRDVDAPGESSSGVGDDNEVYEHDILVADSEASETADVENTPDPVRQFRPYEADWFVSSVTRADLKAYRKVYQIPDDIYLRLPEVDEFPSEPKEGEIALHEELFHFGLRLPVQEYFARLFNFFDLPPYQLNLNGWRVITGLYVIWASAGNPPPSIDEIRYAYMLKKNPKNNPGFYYLQSRPQTPKIVTGSPTCNKDWKHKWFFVGGNWGQSLERVGTSGHVPTSFNREVDLWGKAPTLAQVASERIFSGRAAASDQRNLLSPDSLVGSGLVATAPTRRELHKARREAKTGKSEYLDPDLDFVPIDFGIISLFLCAETMASKQSMRGSAAGKSASSNLQTLLEKSKQGKVKMGSGAGQAFKNLPAKQIKRASPMPGSKDKGKILAAAAEKGLQILQKRPADWLENDAESIDSESLKRQNRTVASSDERSLKGPIELFLEDLPESKRDGYAHLVPIINSLGKFISREVHEDFKKKPANEALELMHKLACLIIHVLTLHVETAKGNSSAVASTRETISKLKADNEELRNRAKEVEKKSKHSEAQLSEERKKWGLERSQLESSISELAARKAEVESELATVDERIQKAKDDGVDEGVDTVYKIIHFTDPSYSISYIYDALGRDPPEVNTPEARSSEAEATAEEVPEAGGQGTIPSSVDPQRPSLPVSEAAQNPSGVEAAGQPTFGTVMSANK